MVPEFSITNIKADDIIKVCEMIKGVTDVKIERYILDAVESGDVETMVNALNLISYVAFKTLLVFSSDNKSLQSDLLQYKN